MRKLIIISADFEYIPKIKATPVTSSIKGNTIAMILMENRGKIE